MKRSSILFFLVALVLNTYSQSENIVSYPGGESELAIFLEKNNLYNTTKYNESIDGTVTLKLLIDSNGQVVSTNVLRRVGLGIDDEAIRLAGLLKFIPAKDSAGKKISSDYILKVIFKKPYYPVVIIDSVYVRIKQ